MPYYVDPRTGQLVQVGQPAPPPQPPRPNTPAPVVGAGDLVKRATDALGIPQCGGCAQRQALLNRLFPFGTGGRS
jgi:hypothetical protein